MIMGLVAKEFKNNDIIFNVSQIMGTAFAYRNTNIDFLCFGETFLQGFDALTWNKERDLDIAISKNDLIIEGLKYVAKTNNMGLAFGYIEKDHEKIYDSYLFIDKNGVEVYNYRRYSSGWKEGLADQEMYLEGKEIGVFHYQGKRIVIGLCGDFWGDDQDYIKQVAEAEKDFVLWPIYVNYSLKKWVIEKNEYSKQSLLFGEKVLMVNSLSKNPASHGGCFYFENGIIKENIPFDVEDVLIIDL